VRILFAASEVYPFAKTGGLADVIGSLPKALQQAGHQVWIVMPRYGSVQGEAQLIGPLDVAMGDGKVEKGALYRSFLDADRKIPVYLVDHQPYFGSRKGLYAFDDDMWRFAFFCRAVVEMLRTLSLSPDVVHCHDWHTGLIPAYLKLLPAGDTSERRPGVVFTIHNLMFQGIFGRDVYGYTGLPWSAYDLHGLEFHGSFNFLKAGAVYADRINTVSPTYAIEIQTPALGHGLDGMLRHHSRKLSGIVNGIDYEVWNPEKDRYLTRQFSARDIARKLDLKHALQTETKLGIDDRVPLFSFVGRLTDQKGMDLIMPILPSLLENGQVVILGTGDPAYHKRLQEIDGPGSHLAIVLKYDETLAHKIYAGSDAFLMPSSFEPCGLGQLIALRYGTLPIVRRTGGLADTVLDADEDRASGTGFAFTDYTPAALQDAVERCRAAYSDKSRWSALVQHAMAQEFSWKSSMRHYEELYRMVVPVHAAA